MDIAFHHAKAVINDPVVRGDISRQYGKKGIYFGDTFWLGALAGWGEHTGGAKKLKLFLDRELKRAKRSNSAKAVIDLSSSSKGGSHYMTLLLNFKDPVDKPYAAGAGKKR